MRVAYLTTRYPSVSHTFIMREVEELRARGLEVDTYSVRRTSTNQLLSPADKEAFESTYALLPARLGDYARAHLRAFGTSPSRYVHNLLDSRCYGTPGLRGRLLPVLWALEAIVLWDRCERDGVAHIHTHFAGAPPVIASSAVRFGGGTLGPRSWSATVHGPVEFLDQALGAKVEDASCVVCISDFARSQVMTFVAERHWDKLVVIHCGLDINAFDAWREETDPGSSPAIQSSGSPLNLLNVGRLVSLKGQGVLLEALALLVGRGLDVRLTMVGDGPRREELVEQAARLGVAEQVEWTGAVGRDRIPAYFAAADVFCLPSFAEGVPTVLMEAMLTETPVVATQIAGVPELVEDGTSGIIVAPGRADAIADAVEKLAADPELRASMGRAGRSKVEAEFDIRHSALQLAAVFASQTGV